MDLVISQTVEMIREKFSGEGSGHDFWHIYRVWQLAKKIAIEEGARIEVVELAALLHDIADWKDHDGDLSAGGKAAYAWLSQLGVDPDIIEEVSYIVDNVSFKGAGVKDQMQSLEGRIVQDSDRLDAMGAIGIARVFAYGGSCGRTIYDPDKGQVMAENFESYKNAGETGINHFYEKLLLLKDRMHTDTGKKMAEKRHQYMEDYLSEFLSEWDGSN